MKALALFGRSRQPVVYEVRLEIDPALATEYDEWLLLHVREMLALPGFQGATAYCGRELAGNGRAVRLVAYRVRSRRELDSYLHTHAARMRADGEKRFGGRFQASRRIVPVDEYVVPEGMAVLYNQQDISGGLPICANCRQPVEGRYCGHCGQEDRTYLMSVFELAGEFIGELLNFDSKLFRTLRPLLFRPGLLTYEYVVGRRHYYLSPVRMYIFISLMFFFLFTLITDFRFDDIEMGNSEAPAETVDGRVLPAEERAEVERALRETETRLGLPEGTLSRASERALHDARRTAEEAARQAQDAQQGETGPPSIHFEGGNDVDVRGFGSAELDARLERGARALQADPAGFARAVMQQVPAMMFIFLPLIALALKLLYIGSHRYYAEHLIFALHFHSAVFVLVLAWLLFGKLGETWSWLAPVSPWVTALVWLYIPYYLYKSMRVVYGQGRFFTIVKFMLLQIAYLSALTTTFVLTLLYTMYQQA